MPVYRVGEDVADPSFCGWDYDGPFVDKDGNAKHLFATGVGSVVAIEECKTDGKYPFVGICFDPISRVQMHVRGSYCLVDASDELIASWIEYRRSEAQSLAQSHMDRLHGRGVPSYLVNSFYKHCSFMTDYVVLLWLLTGGGPEYFADQLKAWLLDDSGARPIYPIHDDHITKLRTAMRRRRRDRKGK